MHHLPRGIACLCLLFGGCAADRNAAPPDTPRIDFSEVMHGVTLDDPYHWIEDMGSAETQSWIAAQNTYSSLHFEKLTGRVPLRKRVMWQAAV